MNNMTSEAIGPTAERGKILSESQDSVPMNWLAQPDHLLNRLLTMWNIREYIKWVYPPPPELLLAALQLAKAYHNSPSTPAYGTEYNSFTSSIQNHTLRSTSHPTHLIDASHSHTPWSEKSYASSRPIEVDGVDYTWNDCQTGTMKEYEQPLAWRTRTLSYPFSGQDFQAQNSNQIDTNSTNSSSNQSERTAVFQQPVPMAFNREEMKKMDVNRIKKTDSTGFSRVLRARQGMHKQFDRIESKMRFEQNGSSQSNINPVYNDIMPSLSQTFTHHTDEAQLVAEKTFETRANISVYPTSSPQCSKPTANSHSQLMSTNLKECYEKMSQNKLENFLQFMSTESHIPTTRVAQRSQKKSMTERSRKVLSRDSKLLSPHIDTSVQKQTNEKMNLRLEAAHTSGAQDGEGFSCQYCGKMFAYQYYRDKHLKYTRCVDQGNRKYPCEQCSRSFEKRDRLRIHILHVHEKRRPHKCHLCEKSFSQSSSLNKHSRVHSGERPYKCNYCHKAFTASSILRTHIRQHSGEKPFKCKFCWKPFASHAAHDSHVKRTHAQFKVTITPKDSFLQLDEIMPSSKLSGVRQ